MEPTLRAPVKTDLPAWEAMVRAYCHEDDLRYREDRQSKAIASLVTGDALARAWMIDVDGVTVGYVVMTISFSVETGGRDGFIDELFIQPDHRNRGLGRRVLDLVDREARKLGLGRLYLEVEHGNPAIRLYRRAGYRDHRRHLLSKWLRSEPAGRSLEIGRSTSKSSTADRIWKRRHSSGDDMMIEAREVTRSNLSDLLRLTVGDDQQHLVASNAVTIAQAHYRPHCWLRGLWSGDRAVGLVAMIDLRPDADEDDPENAAYLWRLMIDREHQGRGYGRQAVELALEQARRWRRDTLCMHVVEGPGNALAFYRRFGLEPTDRIDDGERFLVGPVPIGRQVSA